MEKRKNVILVPGAFGYVPFQDTLERKLEGDIVRPDYMRGGKYLTRQSCNRILDDLANKGILDESSTVVAHSAGTIAFAKWLAANGMSIEQYIAVAGFMGPRGIKFDIKAPHYIPAFAALGFSLKENELVDAAGLVGDKHSFFSGDDSDHLIKLGSLERYANILGGKRHRLVGQGHLGAVGGVTEIPGIEDVIRGG